LSFVVVVVVVRLATPCFSWASCCFR